MTRRSRASPPASRPFTPTPPPRARQRERVPTTPMNDETPAGSVSSPSDQRQARAAGPDLAWAGATVSTIGHSTRPRSALIELLQRCRARTLANVRTIPRARHNPQFNLDELATALPQAGSASVHLVSLGGLWSPFDAVRARRRSQDFEVAAKAQDDADEDDR